MLHRLQAWPRSYSGTEAQAHHRLPYTSMLSRMLPWRGHAPSERKPNTGPRPSSKGRENSSVVLLSFASPRLLDLRTGFVYPARGQESSNCRGEVLLHFSRQDLLLAEHVEMRTSRHRYGRSLFCRLANRPVRNHRNFTIAWTFCFSNSRGTVTHRPTYISAQLCNSGVAPDTRPQLRSGG